MQEKKKTPLAEMLSRRGMTREQGWNASGLSRSTFDILMGGGVTLPQLALKAAKGLRLTQEEAKKLGKPLDKAAWEAKKLPYKNIDVDPEWFKKVGKPLDKSLDTYEMYLDKAALMQVLMERGIDYSAFYNDQPVLANLNRGTPERRRKGIAHIAKVLGIAVGELETPFYLHGHVERRFLVRKSALERLMEQKGMNRVELARAMWTPEDSTKTPMRRMVKLWNRIEEGDTITDWEANRIAEVLSVEVLDFAEIKLEQRKG